MLEKIKKLREKTGTSIADCKKCLDEAGGDMEKAVVLLRKRGAEIANKKSTRTTSEGAIGNYLHSNKKVATLVQVRCETDFVARNEEFQQLVKDIAMHITAMAPEYVSPEDVPEDVKNKEKEIESEKLAKKSKPKEIVDKILIGKMEKFYQRVCLLNQPFIKNDKKTVGDLVKENIQKLGENIEIGEFVRMIL